MLAQHGIIIFQKGIFELLPWSLLLFELDELASAKQWALPKLSVIQIDLSCRHIFNDLVLIFGRVKSQRTYFLSTHQMAALDLECDGVRQTYLALLGRSGNYILRRKN